MNTEKTNRPELSKSLTAETFAEYYWLKAELVSFCRDAGINTSGGKIDISNRIIKFLETGSVQKKSRSKGNRSTSKFDWNNADLTTNSLITDNYKNTENVRAFFARQIGNHFKFNTTFMSWMKSNAGRTLGDAVNEWGRIHELKKSAKYKSEIAPQFEYNTYIREFHSANPGLSSKDAIKCWKIKRNRPGHNKYEDADLDFLSRL